MMRQAITLVDHRRALGLDADPDARPRQPCSAKAEERGVGGMAQPHDARLAALGADAGGESVEDRRQRMAAESAEDLEPEAGRDADHYFLGVAAGRCFA